MIPRDVKSPTVAIPFHKLLKIVAIVDQDDPQIRQLIGDLTDEGFEVEISTRYDRDVSEDAEVGAYIATVDTPWANVPTNVIKHEQQCWSFDYKRNWLGYSGYSEDCAMLVDPNKLRLHTWVSTGAVASICHSAGNRGRSCANGRSEESHISDARPHLSAGNWRRSASVGMSEPDRCSTTSSSSRSRSTTFPAPITKPRACSRSALKAASTFILT